MKKLFIITIVMVVAGYFVAPYIFRAAFTPTDTEIKSIAIPDTDKVRVLATNLRVPWDVARLPNNNLLVTERPGDLLLIDPEVGVVGRTTVPAVATAGEGGLMGIALHPYFASNNFIYLYRTTLSGSNRINQIVRFTYSDEHTLSNETIIIDNIPGATFHDGGALAFGPDNYLYVTTGDAGEPALSRDKNSLAGKTLRVNADGLPASGNPFGNEIYSLGHRNAQGLGWDSKGRLWQTEHGRSGIRSGLDEVNLITLGGDYGWPESQGDIIIPGTIGPIIHSGESDTWAPGGLAFDGDVLYFAGLRGQRLYRVTNLKAEPIIKAFFATEYGRLRATRIFGDTLYLTTSNTDSRGNPMADDDKLLAVPLSLIR